MYGEINIIFAAKIPFYDAHHLGTLRSGITSASHVEGPGFKSHCVYFQRLGNMCVRTIQDEYPWLLLQHLRIVDITIHEGEKLFAFWFFNFVLLLHGPTRIATVGRQDADKLALPWK
eukprot:879026-Amphidinium_carterae.1